MRFVPHYPAKSPLADVFRLVTPGSDEYITEKYAIEIEATLGGWGELATDVPPGKFAIWQSCWTLPIESLRR